MLLSSMMTPLTREELRAPFRSCKRRSDCAGLAAAEGGDGGPADCYRHQVSINLFPYFHWLFFTGCFSQKKKGSPSITIHQDRRNVFAGICLPKR